LRINTISGHQQTANDQSSRRPQYALGFGEERSPITQCAEDLDQHDSIVGGVSKQQELAIRLH